MIMTLGKVCGKIDILHRVRPRYSGHSGSHPGRLQPAPGGGSWFLCNTRSACVPDTHRGTRVTERPGPAWENAAMTSGNEEVKL